MHTEQLEFIDLIYAAAARPEAGWPHVIEKFGARYPSAKTVLGTYYRGEMLVTRSASDIEITSLNDYAAHYAHINPIVPPLLKSKPASYFDADDLVDRANFLSSEVWNDFWQPLGGLVRNVGVILENHGDVFSTFCTHFPDIYETRNFEQTPGYLIRRMMPHLRRALQMQAQMEQAVSASKSFLEALDEVGQAIFLLGATGKVRTQNATAEKLLRDSGIIRVGPNRTPYLVDSEQNDRFKEAIARSVEFENLGDLGKSKLPLVSGNAGALYKITIGPALPDIETMPSIAVLRERQTLIRIEQVGGRKGLEGDILCRVFRLTPAERKLAVALFEGNSLKEVAEDNKLSLQTVRNQLRAIFLKTDTKRQAELISLLSKYAN